MTEVDVKKMAEFVWGKDNVKLLWGHTDECGDFSLVPPGYKKEKFDTEQRLCFFDTCWQIVPDFPNDLNACFKGLALAGNIVGVTFRYYPGMVECEITVSNEGGYSGYESWVDANSEDDSRKKSALALCKAVEQLMEKK